MFCRSSAIVHDRAHIILFAQPMPHRQEEPRWDNAFLAKAKSCSPSSLLQWIWNSAGSGIPGPLFLTSTYPLSSSFRHGLNTCRSDESSGILSRRHTKSVWFIPITIFMCQWYRLTRPTATHRLHERRSTPDINATLSVVFRNMDREHGKKRTSSTSVSEPWKILRVAVSTMVR